MSGNLCGPSNAMKGLSDHMNRDRSHHQDRVVAGPSGTQQNFRSQGPYGANARANEADFAGFQNPNFNNPAFHPAPHPAPQDPRSLAGMVPPSNPVLANAWANANAAQQSSHAGNVQMHSPEAFNQAALTREFQRMQLQNQGANAGQMAPSMASMPPTMWHPGFMFGGNMPGQAFQPPFMNQQPQFAFGPGMAPGSQFNPMAMAQAQDPDTRHATQKELDADFEVEMRAWMDQNGPTVSENAAAENMAAAEPIDIQESEPPTPMHPEQDATELARVAQQLVDSVSGNSSEKFQNSNFLDLMRRIAAQEVVIQGQELVEVEADNPDPALAPGRGSHVTGSASSSASKKPPTVEDVDES